MWGHVTQFTVDLSTSVDWILVLEAKNPPSYPSTDHSTADHKVFTLLEAEQPERLHVPPKQPPRKVISLLPTSLPPLATGCIPSLSICMCKLPLKQSQPCFASGISPEVKRFHIRLPPRELDFLVRSWNLIRYFVTQTSETMLADTTDRINEVI